jgi:type VI secretion system protein ImpA
MFLAAQLLHPIRADQPAGIDLSFSPELDVIAHARTFDDPSLDQGEWISDIKEADWGLVVKQCASLLEHQSKDLRLAVWLTEAAAHQHGMRGLTEGLLVVAGLLDKFWDCGLLPEADGGEHEQRVGNLVWILARLPALLRATPATDAVGGSAEAMACKNALRHLEHAADQRLGTDSPGFAKARDAVEAKIRLAPAVQDYTTLENDQGMPHTPAAPVLGQISTRSEALAQLRAVADFFRRTEPHSPVSYFADKAANVGEQDLASFLRAVVKDPASMAHIEELLGIPPAPP